MLIIVSHDMRRIVFDAYHASAVEGVLGINKTLVVSGLQFMWPDTRKYIITRVKSCTACIQAKSTTFTSRYLVHT